MLKYFLKKKNIYIYMANILYILPLGPMEESIWCWPKWARVQEKTDFPGERISGVHLLTCWWMTKDMSLHLCFLSSNNSTNWELISHTFPLEKLSLEMVKKLRWLEPNDDACIGLGFEIKDNLLVKLRLKTAMLPGNQNGYYVLLLNWNRF